MPEGGSESVREPEALCIADSCDMDRGRDVRPTPDRETGIRRWPGGGIATLPVDDESDDEERGGSTLRLLESVGLLKFFGGFGCVWTVSEAISGEMVVSSAMIAKFRNREGLESENKAAKGVDWEVMKRDRMGWDGMRWDDVRARLVHSHVKRGII